METITFYSYKGGVGRTLMLANAAHYLAMFGFKVFVMDFDLEAPGLHYKLESGIKGGIEKIERGLVDIIYSFVITGQMEAPLQDHVLRLELEENIKGSIDFLPAGKSPSSEYWRRLARINWHELFYEEDSQGVPFFLELQARIEAQYQPDYLLIDARTGVTEMGGVATSILADKVICLLVRNRENFQGVREVIKAVFHSKKFEHGKFVEIILLVTRIPKYKHHFVDDSIKEACFNYFNNNIDSFNQSLRDKIYIIHSQDDIQLSEKVLIGNKTRSDDDFLLEDYLILFKDIFSITDGNI